MSEMDYRSMVNPTYLTAKSTVFMLAGAGNDDAKRMIGALGLQDSLSKGDQKETPFSESDVKALMAGVTLAIEARYAALTDLLLTGQWDGLLDIACGYTPRALFCNRAGIAYTGLDVPVVAEELQLFADKAGLGKVYVGGDATNAASLTAAADRMERSLLISFEGLLHYLSEDEFEQFLNGLRQILAKHGGALVSSDMGVDYEAFAVANMSSSNAAELYNASRRKTMSDSVIFNEGVGHWKSDKMRAFLEEHGFKVEIMPFYHPDERLNILSSVPDAWKKKYLGILENSHVWKMTLDKNYKGTEKISGAESLDNLTVNYEVDGEKLKCTVTGRIDTISAPALLEVFDKNYDAVKGIVVDAENLEYISSAGLRVLLMAVKKLGQGSVKVVNTSDTVKEIFETTGFDQMIDLE